MTPVDVLIPTFQRPGALAVTLTCLFGQTALPSRIVISDQGDVAAGSAPEVSAVIRLLEMHGVRVTLLRNIPRRGLAQQRQFLLDQAEAPYVLFMDDDVMTEPWLIETMTTALAAAGCGFVGSAVIGLSYSDTIHADQQDVQFWDGPVTVERIEPDDPAWPRHRLHNAANLLHVQRALGVTHLQPRLYKVAWVGACVLYDRAKLIASGGFGFWRDVPDTHAGEDVQAQREVMARFGGAGLMPSGAYHQEHPTTVEDRTHDLPRMLQLTA